MRKLFSLSVGAVLVASFLVAACVGDSPALATSGTEVQGDLDTPCFSNGTCNAGLSCSVVKGAAKCVAPAGGPSADASAGEGDATTPSDAADSGPTPCKFQTTTFPCGGQNPPTACYGPTQSCTLTGCGGAELAWQCFSPRQCSAACCVSAANATLNAGANCAQGTLQISGAATTGASCAASTACGAGDTQLCQANSDCPAGQRCSPIKIVGGGAAINGNIVAVCVP